MASVYHNIMIKKNYILKLFKCLYPMFLFILDSDDNEIMAITVHKRKYQEKHGQYIIL